MGVIFLAKQRAIYKCIYTYAGDKIEKIEMGGTCVTYGGRESCAQGFGGET